MLGYLERMVAQGFDLPSAAGFVQAAGLELWRLDGIADALELVRAYGAKVQEYFIHLLRRLCAMRDLVGFKEFGRGLVQLLN